MSDFLSNMATRALGLETSVRPRLPALFGPPTESAFGPAPLLSDLAQEGAEEMAFQPSQTARQHQRMVARTENLRSEAPRLIPTFSSLAISTATPTLSEQTASLTPNRSRESVAPVESSFTASSETRSVPAREDKSSATPVVNTVSSSAPAPPERIVPESVRENSRTEVIVPTETTRVAGVAAPLVTPVEIRPVSAREDLAAPTPVVSAVLPSVPALSEHVVRESLRETSRNEVIVPTETTRVARVAASEISEASAHMTPRPPTPSPFAPTIKPAVPTALTFEATRDQATPQPTIQVTIGRIEVRAHSAPVRKPANNAAAPTGALSLDDYLSQRAGGQR